MQILFSMKALFSLCLCAFALFGCTACDVSSMSSLPEVSRPYVGEYVCEQLTWGSYDLLPSSRLLLNLGYDGTFSLYYRGKPTPLVWGEYEVSQGGDNITFLSNGKTRTFPIENGDLVLRFPINGKLFLGKFSFK